MSLESLTNVGFGGTGSPDRVPKVLAELQGLTITGPLAGKGSGIAIPTTGIEAEDTLVKVLAFGGSGSPDGVGIQDLTSLTTIKDRRASGTITILSTLVDGDKVSVNGKEYTFTDVEETITYNVLPQIVPFQSDPSGVADEEAVAARFAQVIMSSDSALTCTVSGAVVTIIYRTPGTGGNSKVLSVAASNAHATKSATTLLGGTATNSISISQSTVDLGLLVFWFNKQ